MPQWIELRQVIGEFGSFGYILRTDLLRKVDETKGFL
jgi:hypothetical protein